MNDSLTVQPCPPEPRSWIAPWHLAALVCVAAMVVGLGSYPLYDPDEGRHAEIGREMLESRDFVTPRLNYVPYLEKPPLMYWLTAASFALLGQNALALRLVSTLLAVAGMFVAWWLTRECFGVRSAHWAPAIIASSLLYFVVARIPITDMTFSVLLAASLAAWLAGDHRHGRMRWAFYLTAGLLLGFALLAKGPVCLVLFAGVVAVYLLATRRPLEIVPAIGLPLVAACCVALPWFLAVQRATPEFNHFFFIVQHVNRFLGKGKAEHVQPFYYYLVLLPFAFGLWAVYWPPMLQAARRRWKTLPDRPRRDALYLGLWTAVIIVFFSASTCKLVQYILPVWWPLTAVTAVWLRNQFCPEQPRRRLYLPTLISALCVALLLAAAIIGASRQHKVPVELLRVPLLIFLGTGIVSFGLLLFSSWLRNRHWCVAQLAVAAALPLAGLVPAASVIFQQKDLNGLIPPQLMNLPKGTPWTIAQYKTYNQSLTFYTHQRVVLIDTVSELPLGPEQPDGKQWFPKGAETVRELSRRGPLALVVDNEYAERDARDFGLHLWAVNDNRAMLLNSAGLRLLAGGPHGENASTSGRHTEREATRDDGRPS